MNKPLSTLGVIFFYITSIFTVKPRSRYILWKWNVSIFYPYKYPEKLENVRYYA